nr:large conductance mechanosensitive channel protein MscL [Actinomycetales bacterium]
MLQGFKEFISRGNVIELAVGVIIATAFTPVVESVTNLITGLIAAVFGAPNFDYVGAFTLNGTEILPGAIITTLVNFLLVAFAVYFFIVVPMNKLAEGRREEEKEEARPEDVVLLEEIKEILRAQSPRV